MTSLGGDLKAVALRETVRATAGRGDVASQLALAQMLLDGIGGRRDPQQAHHWFRVAAEAGLPLAMTMLGRCHEKGWGTPTNLPRAALCYHRAALCGDDWGRYNLANMLLRGRGVASDHAAAWRLFLAAARNGHAQSMNLAGRFLDEGWLGEGSPEAGRAGAEVWYRRSAEAGDYRGQHNLACVLAESGRVAEALAWWARALLEATPDILAAMQAALMQIGSRESGSTGARRLLAAVQASLVGVNSPSGPA